MSPGTNLYKNVVEGDPIGPPWMNDLEDSVGHGTPAQMFNYIFWSDGTDYYVRDGESGEREDVSNFGTGVNEKILDLYDSAAGTGGHIGCHGHFELDRTINGRPGVHTWGSGRCGHDTSYDRLGCTITATTNVPMFLFDNPDSAAIYHQGLHHMWLEGDSKLTSSAAVDLNPTTQNLGDVFLEDLSIVNVYNGIRIRNEIAAGAKNIWNVFVERNFIESCTDAAISIFSSTDGGIYQNHFDRNHFYNNNTATGNGAFEMGGTSTYGNTITNNTFVLEKKNSIYLDDEANHNNVINNIIWNGSQTTDNTDSGINLVDVDYIKVNNNQCVKIGAPAKEMKYGIESDNNCTYCDIQNNTVDGKTLGILKGTGTGMIVRNNVGYITENSGIGTIGAAATSETIAHGLSVTPTVDDFTITMAENPTNVITAFWVDTIGAANFNVNCEGVPGASELDFGWRVHVL